MSSPSARTAAAREPAASVPPRFYGLLKASTAFVAACMLLQGITAGQLLDGAIAHIDQDHPLARHQSVRRLGAFCRG